MLPLLLSLWEVTFRHMVMKVVSRSRVHFNEVEGQGLVEYALILVLVAVVVVVALMLMGPALGNMFSNITCGVFKAQNMECLG
jgi:pilus assembly protein Flp/PilA